MRKYWDAKPKTNEVEDDTQEKASIPEWANSIDWDYLEEELKNKTPKKILFKDSL